MYNLLDISTSGLFVCIRYKKRLKMSDQCSITYMCILWIEYELQILAILDLSY